MSQRYVHKVDADGADCVLDTERQLVLPFGGAQTTDLLIADLDAGVEKFDDYITRPVADWEAATGGPLRDR